MDWSKTPPPNRCQLPGRGKGTLIWSNEEWIYGQVMISRTLRAEACFVWSMQCSPLHNAGVQINALSEFNYLWVLEAMLRQINTYMPWVTSCAHMLHRVKAKLVRQSKDLEVMLMVLGCNAYGDGLRILLTVSQNWLVDWDSPNTSTTFLSWRETKFYPTDAGTQLWLIDKILVMGLRE